MPPTCAPGPGAVAAATCSVEFGAAAGFGVTAAEFDAATCAGFDAATTCAVEFGSAGPDAGGTGATGSVNVNGVAGFGGVAATSVSTEFDDFDSTFAGSTDAACAFLLVLIF